MSSDSPWYFLSNGTPTDSTGNSPNGCIQKMLCITLRSEVLGGSTRPRWLSFKIPIFIFQQRYRDVMLDQPKTFPKKCEKCHFRPSLAKNMKNWTYAFEIYSDRSQKALSNGTPSDPPRPIPKEKNTRIAKKKIFLKKLKYMFCTVL